MRGVPHYERAPWVDEPILLSLLVDEILATVGVRNWETLSR